MSDTREVEWVLPTSIPFSDLKGRDLEECVYWLLDAMGARDLIWRIGGTGGGAADGGRDLEAHFHLPTVDGEIETQKWWIECKGRTGTVEADAVKSTVINAQAVNKLDCLLIVTNTTFSNPTHDWVKTWQEKRPPPPKIKLWDQTYLERYLSRHPSVVLRLFSQALSIQGQFQAVESRFWNKLEFTTSNVLAEIWKERDTIDASNMGLFGAIVNEFAVGNIARRSWCASLDTETFLEVFYVAFVNVPYLRARSINSNAEQRPIIRALAYLILVAIDRLPAENVAKMMHEVLFDNEEVEMPHSVQEYLLMPIIDQLLSEIQDVCASDCRRISQVGRNELTEDKDEVDTYWLRLELDENEEEIERSRLRIEQHDAPCKVGFAADEDHHCPLFSKEPTLENTAEILEILQRVVAFRKAEAADVRGEEKRRLAKTRKSK